MRNLIWASFITTCLFITVLSAQTALDPNLMLYFTFDEQLDGKMIEDMSGGGNNGKLKLGAKTYQRASGGSHRHGGVKKSSTMSSAQFRVDSFKRMDTYGDNTYAFWLYIFGLRKRPGASQTKVLWKKPTL